MEIKSVTFFQSTFSEKKIQILSKITIMSIIKFKKHPVYNDKIV